VGTEAALSIFSCAEKCEGFKSLEDLCSKTGLRQVSKKTLESLAKAGALDSLYPNEKPEISRAKILDNIDDTLTSASCLKQELESGQRNLFGEDSVTLTSFKKTNTEEREIKPLAEHTLLNYEKEVLGFYLSGHPLAKYEQQIKMISPTTIEHIHFDKNLPEIVTVAGLIESVKKKTSKRRELWANFELEDMTSSINVNVFPKNYARLENVLKPNTIVVVKGKINRQSDSTESEIFAEDIIPLESILTKFTNCFIVSFSAELADEKIKELNKLLGKYEGDIPVYLKLHTKHSKPVLVKTKKSIALSNDLFIEVENLLGQSSWEIKTNLK
jgi:DNA polymerase-3 subunit alpha